MIMPEKSPFDGERRVIPALGDMGSAVLYSAESEKAVLGCMLGMPNEVIDEAVSTLKKEDFFVPAYQEIFAVLREMHDKSQAIDVMTIHQWLTDRKMAEAVGSPGILAELLVGYATHLHIRAYIRTVKDKSLLRGLQMACSTIVQDIADMPDSVPAVLDRAEQQIMAVTASGLTLGSFPRPGTVMDAEMDRIISYDGRRPLIGIPSGFHKLDELTGGWKPGEMIVLAARPGGGKTALAIDFMHAAAPFRWDEKINGWQNPGHRVAMINLEMPENQLELRRLSKKSGIPLQALRRGLTDDKERQILVNAREAMRPWTVVIRDVCYLTTTQCRSMARRLKSEFQIDLLVIDYLQLMSEVKTTKDYNRQVEVANISRGIKALAKELGIPIIILAQLNRQSAETKQVPGLHNLRESGAIEQDADVVMLLHKHDPETDQDGNEVHSPIRRYTLNLAKQRNGPTDELEIHFHTSYAKFEEPVKHQ